MIAANVTSLADSQEMQVLQEQTENTERGSILLMSADGDERNDGPTHTTTQNDGKRNVKDTSQHITTQGDDSQCLPNIESSGWSLLDCSFCGFKYSVH